MTALSLQRLSCRSFPRLELPSHDVKDLEVMLKAVCVLGPHLFQPLMCCACLTKKPVPPNNGGAAFMNFPSFHRVCAAYQADI
mmetsp:Transcript_40169/g.76787  ORF Transcript_40169/g.76787 Transcript_40169/m.76787 type:complete len:83 (-) Transcript_40169:479-727(-)